MAPNLQLSLGTVNREKTTESSGKETTTTTKDKITSGSISQTSDSSEYSSEPIYDVVENYVSNPSTNNEEDDIPNNLNKCTVKQRLNFNIVVDNEGTTQSSFPRDNPPDVHVAKVEGQQLTIHVYPHRMTRSATKRRQEALLKSIPVKLVIQTLANNFSVPDKSRIFYTNDLKPALDLMITKNFICQQKLLLDNFNLHTGVTRLLEKVGLLQTVVKIDRFVKSVGFQIEKDDCFETEVVPIKVDSRLLVHDHAEDIRVTKFTPLFPKSHQQEMVQAREKITNAFLSSLLWDFVAPARPSQHTADSSASNLGYTPLALGDTTKSRVA
nr:uncharacterized protein LOC109169177 [Ipomoea batatas]